MAVNKMRPENISPILMRVGGNEERIRVALIHRFVTLPDSSQQYWAFSLPAVLQTISGATVGGLDEQTKHYIRADGDVATSSKRSQDAGTNGLPTQLQDCVARLLADRLRQTVLRVAVWDRTEGNRMVG